MPVRDRLPFGADLLSNLCLRQAAGRFGFHASHWLPWDPVGVHIDRDAEEYPYEQLAAYFREPIRSRADKPGAKLPSYATITAETGLDAKTIRRPWKRSSARAWSGSAPAAASSSPD